MAQSKEAFFTELARLGSLTDDSEDTDDENFARLLSGSKPVEGKDAVTSISASPSALASNANANAKGIARTFSAPQTSPPTGGPELQPQVPSMKRANTTGTLSEGNKVEGPNRRRRTYTPRTVPGQRQIFKGLGFCKWF